MGYAVGGVLYCSVSANYDIVSSASASTLKIMDHMALEEWIAGYSSFVEGVIGTYFDASLGFFRVSGMIRDAQRRILEIDSDMTESRMDALSFMYSDGDPGEKSSEIHHKITQGEMKKRNSPGDRNEVFVANMAIITIYTAWEVEYRPRIVELLGQAVTSDIMGDLRFLRHAILHKKGIADSDVVRKSRLLHWYSDGEPIVISKMQLLELQKLIGEDISRISKLLVR